MRKYFERLYGKKSTTKKSQSNDPPKETDHAATNNEPPPRFIPIPKKLRSHSLSGSSSWSNKFKSLSKIGSSHDYSRPIAVPSTVHPPTNVILSSATENASTSSDQPAYIGHADPINNTHMPLKRPVLLLTVGLCETYNKCNPDFHYSPNRIPRRVLTKPSVPSKRSQYDNEKGDYILCVHDVLGDTHDSKRYVVQDMLGAGTFGQVAKCRNIESGRLYGVKVIKSKAAYYTQALVEVGILKYLNRECDPNDERHIVRLKHTFVHKHHLCLVFELLSINLYELLKHNRFRGLPTAIIRTFCEQLLEGLATLREAGIIHCDLKPENILLKSLKRPQIKIADFGSACRTNERLHTYIQSRFYRSPEVLIGMRYSTPIDMWSLGCILAELFLGVPLFPGTSEYNQLALITHVLGLPPSSMLQQGRHTRHFFNRKMMDGGNIQYELKSRKQYMDETQQVEKPNKKIYSTNDLMDLILTNPMPRKQMNPSEKNQETRVRLLMADFLTQVLQLDPSRRLTPHEGKLHGFIMSAHSLSRSVHDRSHFGGAMAAQSTIVGCGDLETCVGSPDSRGGGGGGVSPRDSSADLLPVAPQTNDSDLLPSYMKKEEAYFCGMPSVARRFTR